MNKLNSILLAIGTLVATAHCQPSIQLDQVSLSVEGLASKYAVAFKDHKGAIVDFITDNHIQITTRPLRVRVFYEDGEGMIQIIVRHDNEALFEYGSKDYAHYQEYRQYFRNFVSLYGVKELMEIIEDYRLHVAQALGKEEGMTEMPNGDIMKFNLCVRLVNKDQSWVQFYGGWVVDPRADLTGYKRFGFDSQATIKYKKESPVTFEATNDSQDQIDFGLVFFLGKALDLGDKPTEYFNVYKFFSIPITEETQ